ncbi:hypothetical protein FRX31_008960 [Thalictrum thalictroides]|uniref:Uncharacterized protein n=1 Tax=Thalictrum thalictroides TaxID=46969 RepID=A0A7J6WWN9_THATH|nr:hypothetical protein FRX31_008960 [Thalictrum thalictroides]
MGGCKCNLWAECQLCGCEGHTAYGCPLLYAQCIIPGCQGIMKLYTEIGDDKQEVKYLICQYDLCPGQVFLKRSSNGEEDLDETED